ncbi:MAG: prepilin-type N-terminal cleavage/methylation domain-containing protein [Opitutales bacterium]
MTTRPPPPPAARHQSQRGMTVVEVLIAATLLTFVVAGSIATLVSGMQYARHARMTTLAGQVTQSVMEQLRLNNYATINGYAARAQPVSFNSVIGADNFTSGFTSGMSVSAQFTVQVASSTGTLGKTLVVVTATWPEQGTTYTRKTVSLFTEKGLTDYIYAGWSNL